MFSIIFSQNGYAPYSNLNFGCINSYYYPVEIIGLSLFPFLVTRKERKMFHFIIIIFIVIIDVVISFQSFYPLFWRLQLSSSFQLLFSCFLVWIMCLVLINESADILLIVINDLRIRISRELKFKITSYLRDIQICACWRTKRNRQEPF